jgi:hypothetical protein
MRTFGRNLLLFILFLLITIVVFGAFWLGMVPQRYSPFAPLSLERPPGWFLDAKLAILRHDPELCQSVLKEPHIDAAPVPDQPLKDGCGWVNSVRFSQTGGASIGIDKLTCEMAAALTLWVEYEVQPLALATFGKRVTGMQDMGVYSCRNIIGSPLFKFKRSQHATANALDIGGFKLEDGRMISVLKDWKGAGPEAKFLHTVHARACHYFRVAIGPDFNDEHKNHFHYDRGLGWICR